MDGLHTIGRRNTDMVDYAANLHTNHYMYQQLPEAVQQTTWLRKEKNHPDMVFPSYL
jgi:hypothetical protein